MIVTDGGSTLGTQTGSGLQREAEVRKRLCDGPDPPPVKQVNTVFHIDTLLFCDQFLMKTYATDYWCVCWFVCWFVCEEALI